MPHADPTPMGPPPQDPVSGRLAIALRAMAQQASAILADHLKGTGLSVPRFIVLSRLAAHGPLPQNRLGRMAAMEPANIHAMVRALRAQRLVECRADADDARQLLVALTPAGRELIGRVKPMGAAADRQISGNLTQAECETLTALLARLAAAQ